MSDTIPAPRAPTTVPEHVVSDGNMIENGGADEGSEVDAEAMLDQLVAANDHLFELKYAPHLVVLEAIAILNETEEIGCVRTGLIREVHNRITTDGRDRPNIVTSLNALDEMDFIWGTRADIGNAYDWRIAEKGREVLTHLYEQGIIEGLAGGEVTDDLE